jgi:hypothetical protein
VGHDLLNDDARETWENLFVAGRCPSASQEALGSARVIGTCLATGEAAARHAPGA